MKRPLCVAILGLAGLVNSASANDWIFLPSYYSHHPTTQVRIARQYSTGPVFTRSVGEYTTTGYRYVRSAIIVGGGTYDVINNWDSWYQVGAKY